MSPLGLVQMIHECSGPGPTRGDRVNRCLAVGDALCPVDFDWPEEVRNASGRTTTFSARDPTTDIVARVRRRSRRNASRQPRNWRDGTRTRWFLCGYRISAGYFSKWPLYRVLF